MSTETPQSEPTAAPLPDPRVEVPLSYRASSGLRGDDAGARLALFTNTSRAPVRYDGVVADPLRLREALSALHAVVASDSRYVPKDRSAYLAFQRGRKQGNTAADSARARQEYLDWIRRNDPMAWLILDPVVSVFPDALTFEVFSKDEGTYACLRVDRDAISPDGEVSLGTTNVDFSDMLFEGVQRMRSYRKTRLSVGAEAVALSTADAGTAVEKSINLPDSWLRGFLQVQSAATLPATRLSVAPIDLYNLLRQLRFNADQKGKGRGLRVELVPGETPRLVLEPWELVLPTHANVYTERRAQVVRVWGRRRLMLLQRWLPFAEQVEIHLLGSGLPSFWVLKGQGYSFTLGMTGFTAGSWAQALHFDLLLPRAGSRSPEQDKLAAELAKRYVATADELVKATSLSKVEVLRGLQLGCQAGELMYDLPGERYRVRPLLATPPDPDRLRYRTPEERAAHDLLAIRDAVNVVKENRILGEGLELVGKVVVAAEKREYRPQMMLTEDDRVKKAECTCAFYRQHKMKEGPCAHLVALRLLQAQQEAERIANRGKQRSSITVETRTYVRRHDRGEDIYRVSLDQKGLQTQWGQRGAGLRSQKLVFNSVPEARDAYFARVEALEAKGFLDASAG